MLGHSALAVWKSAGKRPRTPPNAGIIHLTLARGVSQSVRVQETPRGGRAVRRGRGVTEIQHSTDVPLLRLPASARAFTLKVSRAPNSVECLFSMTLLRGAAGNAVGWQRQQAAGAHLGRGDRGDHRGRACWIMLIKSPTIPMPNGWAFRLKCLGICRDANAIAQPMSMPSRAHAESSPPPEMLEEMLASSTRP
jgi:hypothetical protein